MPLTEKALTEARDYARTCVEEAGREYARVVTVRMLVNGYDVTDRRSVEGYFYAVETVNAVDTDTLVILHDGDIPSAENAHYIIDDGLTVTVRYVAGWNASQLAVYLAPFPVNIDSEGNVITRPDNGLPVDYSGWMLNPRRAYHVKLRRGIPALNGRDY